MATAIAFSSGQRFRFKGEDEVYTFLGLIQPDQQLLVVYENKDGKEKVKGITFLTDLEHI